MKITNGVLNNIPVFSYIKINKKLFLRLIEKGTEYMHILLYVHGRFFDTKGQL